MLVPIKGIKRYKAKGVWYAYHRATGARIKADFGTAAFVLEVGALDKKAAKKAPPGTLQMVIDAYKASDHFADLAPATRLSYQRAFDEMALCGALPIVTLTTGEIVEARDAVRTKRGRWMANYFVTVLGVVCDFARERGVLQHNPAKGIRRIKKDKSRPAANRPWTWQECRAVIDAAPPYLKVPIALAMLAGFRKGDVLTLPRDVIRDGMVYHTTSKTSAPVAIPIHPTLANALAAAPPHSAKTLAANSRGETWTESGFNSTFGKMIGRLEQAGVVAPGLTMHGLRHTLATRMVEAGADLETVKDILGHKTLKMASHYSSTADRTEKAEAVFDNLRVFEARVRSGKAK